MSATVGDDDIVGVQFNLRTRYPHVDICDLPARVDPYGLGPGIYLLNAHACPPHPQTLSYLAYSFLITSTT